MLYLYLTMLFSYPFPCLSHPIYRSPTLFFVRSCDFTSGLGNNTQNRCIPEQEWSVVARPELRVRPTHHAVVTVLSSRYYSRFRFWLV